MNPSASSVSTTKALLSFGFILFVAIAALSYLVLPAVVPASAPAADLSAERAIEHLKVIARKAPSDRLDCKRAREFLLPEGVR